MLPGLVAVAGAELVVAFFLASQVTPLVKLGQNVVDVVRFNKGARVLVKSVTGAFVARLASDLRLTLKLQRSGAAVADRSHQLEITLICKLFTRLLALISLVGYNLEALSTRRTLICSLSH